MKITVTDPYTFSRRFIRAIRDQDVVLDCFVENLPPLTTVSVLEFVHLNTDLYYYSIFFCIRTCLTFVLGMFLW